MPSAPVAQRIEHLTSDQKVGSSSLSGRANEINGSGCEQCVQEENGPTVIGTSEFLVLTGEFLLPVLPGHLFIMEQEATNSPAY